MKKQNYSKPFMVTEKFTPQYFCAGCTITKNMIYSPVPETNGEPGWQKNDMGIPIDSDQHPWAISSKFLAVGENFEVVTIDGSDSTYPHDTALTYYEIHLSAPAEVYEKKTINGKTTYVPTGLIFNPDQIFYHNYNFLSGGTIASSFWYPKNQS